MDDISQQTGTGTDARPAARFSTLFWLVLLAGITFSVIAWRIAMHYEQQVAVTVFEVDAKEQSLLIREELETASSALEDLASMYAVVGLVSGEQFSRFVSPILARHPALQALSWNPVVTHAERAAHEATQQKSGLPEYRITQRSAQGDFVTAAPRQQYVVVAAIEPLEHNLPARGFDVASEATRRAAMERARDTASLSVAAPITLVQSRQENRSALGFLPTYRTGAPTDTIEQRRAALRGFFVVVIDPSKTIAAALANLTGEGIKRRIMTTPPGGAPALLWVSDGFPDMADKPGVDIGAADRLRHSISFPWGGHVIDIEFAAADGYVATGKTWVPWGILIASLTLTLLTAAMVHLLRRRNAEIARQVARQTRDLQASNSRLHAEVAQRKKIEQRLEAYQLDLEREVAARTAELKATTTQLRTILNSEPECVKIVTADGKLENMNAAGLAMIESDSLETVLGCDVYSLIDDEYRDAFIKLNERVIAGRSETLEFKLHGLRGGERWVETHAVPLIDPDGGPNRHLAITRDITEKKASEEKQALLEGQLRHTQKLESIGVLAGGIAHDFNNILQVIVGNSEIALQDTSLAEHVRTAIEAGQAAAIDAAKLCDQMLTYAGQSRSTVQPIHLPEIVESIINLLGVSHSKNAELELVTDRTQDLIDGDDAQLRQVVMNLVTNASEAIGDQAGRIVVDIRTITLTTDVSSGNWLGSTPTAGRYVSLDVTDSGCGMDAQTQERMFDPFFTTKFAGRGLGLSATLGIVQSHNGYLRVKSATGRGTQITVLFPVAASAKRVVPMPASRQNSFDLTVLLVDDEPGVRKIGKAMLERLGCRVVIATHGEEAVAYFATHGSTIDVVLLDLAMPKMSGNETCAQLRRVRPDIAVIFCSGYAPNAVQPASSDAGYTGFLHKPYSLDALVGVLEEASKSLQQDGALWNTSTADV